jgi:alpha-ketoglutarate-dependent taurine dioxygenase
MSPADIDTFLRRDSHTVETRWDDWGALWYSIQRPVVCHPETAQGPVLYNHLINLAQDSAERSSTLDALFESFSDVLSPVGYSKEVVESLLVDFTNIGGLVTVNREPIPDYVLHDMRQVIARNTIALSLEENDILLLDNQRTMHGRLAYEGDRQMWVSMAGAYQC